MEELYCKIGGNYRGDQSRLGNDRIIERFIRRFVQEKTFEHLKAAYDANDEHERNRRSYTNLRKRRDDCG